MTGPFLAFAAIGAAGFVVDVAVLYLFLKVCSVGLYAARVGSFLCAGTFTWFMNRTLTFRHVAPQPWRRQWLSFLSANALGGLVNYGLYALLVATQPIARQWPLLAVAAGSLSGLVLNFTLSRSVVFKPMRQPPSS